MSREGRQRTINSSRGVGGEAGGGSDWTDLTPFTLSRLLIFMKPPALSRGWGVPRPHLPQRPRHVLLCYRLPFASCSFSAPTYEPEMESLLTA